MAHETLNRLLVATAFALGLAACSGSDAGPVLTPEPDSTAAPTTLTDPQELIASQYETWFESNSVPVVDASGAMSDSLQAIAQTDLLPEFCSDLYAVWGDNYGTGTNSTVFDWISSAQQNPDFLMGQAMVDMSEHYLGVLDACVDGNRELVVAEGDLYDEAIGRVLERNKHWIDRQNQ